VNRDAPLGVVVLDVEVSCRPAAPFLMDHFFDGAAL